MKKTFIFSALIILLLIGFKNFACSQNASLESDKVTSEKLKSEVEKVKNLISNSEKYNQEIAFLIDMKIHSGKNRFFVYDLKTDKIIEKGLVAHGSGLETQSAAIPKFSNKDGSLCTSLGKYAVGGSYNGKFGKSYKLYGLDESNSNAFNRNIVLHQYADVPFGEQDDYICNSFGCPMVNKQFYSILEKTIDNSKKQIILSIYY